MLKLTEWQIEQRREEARALVEQLATQSEWDYETCENLCDLAGMEEEWDNADGSTFEDVVYAAVAVFGLEL